MRTWGIHSLILPPIPKSRGGGLVLSSLIAWGSERDDIDTKIYDEISKLSLLEIFAEYDKVVDGDRIKDRSRYTHLLAVIADKFELPLRDTILPFISNLFNDLSDRTDELEKILKTHRHDASKAYTEKASW